MPGQEDQQHVFGPRRGGDFLDGPLNLLRRRVGVGQDDRFRRREQGSPALLK